TCTELALTLDCLVRGTAPVFGGLAGRHQLGNCGIGLGLDLGLGRAAVQLVITVERVLVLRVADRAGRTPGLAGRGRVAATGRTTAALAGLEVTGDRRRLGHGRWGGRHRRGLVVLGDLFLDRRVHRLFLGHAGRLGRRRGLAHLALFAAMALTD